MTLPNIILCHTNGRRNQEGHCQCGNEHGNVVLKTKTIGNIKKTVVNMSILSMFNSNAMNYIEK